MKKNDPSLKWVMREYDFTANIHSGAFIRVRRALCPSDGWVVGLFGPTALNNKRFWTEDNDKRGFSHISDAQREGEAMAGRYLAAMGTS